jgi:hypothetical protein
VGCVAFRTIQAVGDDGVAWLSERGIEVLRRGQGIRLASAGLQAFFRDQVNYSTIATTPGIPCAAYRPTEQRYHLAVPTIGAQNDFVVVCYVGTQKSDGKAACTTDQFSVAGGGTLYIDDDGELAFSAEADRHRVRLVDGNLTLAAPGEPGLYVTSSVGPVELSLLTTDHTPAALAVVDLPGSVNALVSLGYDGYARKLETGDEDDVTADGAGGAAIGMQVQTRPHFFKAPFERKRGRVVEVLAVAGAASTLQVGLVADGTAGALKSVTVPAAANDQPRHARVLRDARGRALQANVLTSDDVTLVGIDVQAEPLGV